jgi:hypothetical protein
LRTECRGEYFSKRDEVTGDWRNLHNEELHNFYSWLNIIQMKSRRLRWTGYVARMERRGILIGLLVGKPGGKRPLGRPRRRWVNNIKIDLREIGWNGMYWLDLTQDRDQRGALVNTVMNLQVRYNAGKFLSGWPIGSFSRRAQLRKQTSNAYARISFHSLQQL